MSAPLVGLLQDYSPITLANEASVVLLGEGFTNFAFKPALLAQELKKDTEDTSHFRVDTLSLSPDETELANSCDLHLYSFTSHAIETVSPNFFFHPHSLYILFVQEEPTHNYAELHYWLQQLKIFAPDAPVLFLHNKAETKDTTSQQPIPSLFSGLQPTYFHSCFLDNDESSLAQIRQAIITLLCKDSLNLPFQKALPSAWQDIRDDILEMKKAGQMTLDYSKFQELCQEKHGLRHQLSISKLANYFASIGIFSYYPENIWLQQTIFLDKAWLLQALDRIKTQENNREAFTSKAFSNIYQNTAYEGHEAVILELLQELGICHKIATNSYVFPEYFLNSSNRPTLGYLHTKEYPKPLQKFTLTYPQFLPKGIFKKFIVANYKDIGKLVQQGVILNCGEARALMYEEPEKKRICIYIASYRKPHKRHLNQCLNLIEISLRRIHRDILLPSANYPRKKRHRFFNRHKL